MDLVPTGIIIAEAPSGRIVRGNREMARILGYAVDSGSGLHAGFWHGLHPDGRPLLQADYPMAKAVAGIATEGMVVQMQRGDGSYCWVRINGAPVRRPDGSVAFGMITVNDIGLERQAQAELTETVATRTAALDRSQAITRALFEHSPIGMLVLQVPAAGPVTVVAGNAAFAATTGTGPGALAGKAAKAALPEQTGAILDADARTCLAEGAFDCQHTLVYPCGERFVRTFYSPLPGMGVTHVLLTQLDLTESRRVETALRQTMRLEAIGQLTGGVAHEFNNLLTAILGSLELLSRRLAEERQLRWVQTAVSAARRGAVLTQQLLAYARKQFLAPVATDVPAAVLAMTELIRGSLGGRIALGTDFPPDTWPALADPAQLEMALLNLVVNARDAMPAGGRLTVATANLAEADPDLPPELARGPYTRLSVTDTGTGMSPEVAARAMEPFFTTKGIGQGSGLGLAHTYGYAQQLGGTVRLRSIPGSGTTVDVFLPRATDARDGRGSLLLVDDDEDVRRSAAALLREDGWVVHEAANGAAALDALAHAPFAAILADVAMPGMSGLELATLARRRDTHLPIIFLTGDGDPAMAAALPGPMLAKPYSSDDLLALVSQVAG